MTPALRDIWVYLAATPLLWLTATLLAYWAAFRLHERAGRAPLLNPVALAVAALVLVLSVSGTSYEAYFEGAQFVHFLLGPAIVALAVPLYAHRRTIAASLLPMAAALLAGSIVAVLSALAIAALLGASAETLWSLAPKSVTAPVAMGIAEKLGGLPSLAAVLVIATGITGAMIATPLLNVLRIRDWRARGFSVGVAAHGIGTARAFQVNELAGTFAGIAMGLNALLTAVLVPLVAAFLR